MATKQQIPVLAGVIVSNQDGFSNLSNEDVQWGIQNGEAMVAIFTEAIKNRARAVVTFLRLIAKGIALGATDGKWTIEDAEKIFTAGISSDLRALIEKMDRKPTDGISTEVHQITQDGKLKEFFDSLGRPRIGLVMSGGQWLSFCVHHKAQLGHNWTFFLVEVEGELFVVIVHAYSDGRLHANVDRFSHDYVWHAEDEHRLVVPQQKLGS